MSLSSAVNTNHRHNSPSVSPLSPTVIHYCQKYQRTEVAQYHDHRHCYQKQSTHHVSHRISTFRQYHHSPRTNRTHRRRQSPNLWEVHKSSNGRIYYYNVITDRSQWEKPSKEQLSHRLSSFTRKSMNTHYVHSKRVRKKKFFQYNY